MVLVQTSAGQRLSPSAAQSYEALNSAFTARFGKRLNISSGARTYEEQVKIFTTNNQLTPIKWSPSRGYITRYWQGRTWYLKPGYATAAVPGTSNHEDPPGRAADFGSGVQAVGSAEHNWMLQNAGNYGWEWTGRSFVTIEPWHWEHTGSWSGGGSTTPEEDDMDANQANQLTYVYNAMSKPYGDQLTAIINVLRSEISPQIAQAVLFPGQPFNGFQALANNQVAMTALIKALDPNDEADIAAFETKLKESEARTAQTVKASVESLAVTLKSQIAASIAESLGEGVTVPPEAISDALDSAFGKIFVNYKPTP